MEIGETEETNDTSAQALRVMIEGYRQMNVLDLLRSARAEAGIPEP